MNLSAALNLAPMPAPTSAGPAVVAFVGAGGKSSAMFTLARELVHAGRRVVTTTTTRIAAAQIALAPAFVPVTGTELPLAQITAALDAHGHCMLIGRETVEHGDVYKRAGIAPDLIDGLVARSVSLGLDAVLVEADGSRMLPLKAPAAHEPVLPTTTTLLVPVAGMDVIGRRLDATNVHRPELVRELLGLPAHDDIRVTPAHVAVLLADPRGGRKGQGRARVVALLNKVDLPQRLPLARLVAVGLLSRGVPCVLAAVGTSPTPNEMPVSERWMPWTAVILAAGASTRMGRAKQLLSLDGEPLVVRAARTALRAGAADVLVITGAQGDDVAHALDAAGLTPAERVRAVHNAAWSGGQASSVAAAVAALEPDTGAAVFFPVDQPSLSPRLLRQLVAAWQRGADLVAPVVDGRVRGAPCLFGPRYWPELAALTGDVGGRVVLQRHVADAVLVPASTAELHDVDTPDQWSQLRNSLHAD